MSSPPITDHIDQALGKLIDHYKGKPRFAAWVAAHVRRWQEIEDAGQALLAAWDVDTCDLTRLRTLAKIVGQPEIGTPDQFRMFVKARVAVNRSRGRVSDLKGIGTSLLGPVKYEEPGTAHFIIRPVNAITTPIDPVLAARMLRDAKPAGVGMTLIYSTQPPERRFRFSSAAVPRFNSAQGFDSNVLPQTRGQLSSAT